MQRPPSGIPATRRSTATPLPGPSALLRYAEHLEFGAAVSHSISALRQLANAADQLGLVEGVSVGAIAAGMDSRQRMGIEMWHDDETAHLALFEGAQERLVVLE
jgi:hypothetical protein